jgi:hypothetical protein
MKQDQFELILSPIHFRDWPINAPFPRVVIDFEYDSNGKYDVTYIAFPYRELLALIDGQQFSIMQQANEVAEQRVFDALCDDLRFLTRKIMAQ